MLSQDVCPSVCLSVSPSVRPSVTRRYSVETANILKLFHLRVTNYTTLVFPYQTACHHSDGDPLTGASNARRYEKSTNISLYLGRAIITTEGE